MDKFRDFKRKKNETQIEAGDSTTPSPTYFPTTCVTGREQKEREEDAENSLQRDPGHSTVGSGGFALRDEFTSN